MPSINAYSLLQILQQNQQSAQQDQKTHAVPQVMHQLKQTLTTAESLIGSLGLEKGITCTLNLDFWNDFGTHGAKQMQDRNALCGIRFRRGAVFKVDFGHLNIGREQSFGHMAIVLGNFKGLIVVVPIQTDRNQVFPQDTGHAVLKLPARGRPFLTRDSLVQIQQIQAVSKNRIYEDTGHSMAQDPVLEAIERKIVQLYAPYVKKLYTEELQAKDEQIASLQALVAQLREQVVEQSSVAAPSREEK